PFSNPPPTRRYGKINRLHSKFPQCLQPRRMAIRTIAMIGTGTQGRAIALLVLRVGYRVILEDFSISTLKEGEASIRDALSKQFANVAISNEQSDHTLDWTNADSSRDAISNLSIRTSVQDAIRDAHLIIETAAAELEP